MDVNIYHHSISECLSTFTPTFIVGRNLRKLNQASQPTIIDYTGLEAKPTIIEHAGLEARSCARCSTNGTAQNVAGLYLGKGNNKSRQVEQLIEEMMGLVAGAEPLCPPGDIYLECENGRTWSGRMVRRQVNASTTHDYPYQPACAISSLYIMNLPDKLQKHDLRLSLYTLFSTYGPVLDIVALKTKGMRGQAHIVFRDIQASTQAMRALQGFDFFGREMKIQYGKGKSDTVAKLDGTYRMPSAAVDQITSSEIQQSIFNGPPTSSIPATAPPPVSLPKPPEPKTNGTATDGGEPHGVKRGRGDESDDEGAPMEEDDSDAPMEASSDED
ncbi:MAG: hypothetical protein Q9222_001670 [Ikaeria aurantiellina]